MTDHAKIISKNLRRIAYERGKTQAEISRDLKINKSSLSMWMNGERIPRMSKIDMLCDYFGVSRSDIMDEHSLDEAPSSFPVYYTDAETAKAAQEVFDDPDLRMLFDAARDAKPENIRFAAEMLRKFKETNPDG